MRGLPVRLAVSFLGLGLSAAGCECDGGDALGRIVPKIAVSPESIDFGEVPVGGTKIVSLVIDNPGQARLEIQNLDTSDPFSAAVYESEVEAGSRTVIDVAFSPVNDQAQLGQLVIVSNADGQNSVTVTLSGIGVESVVEIVPLRIDLSNTTVNTSREVELVISNRGIEEVSGALRTERFIRPQHFALTGLASFASTGPMGVGPRSSTTLDLVYRPLDSGPDDGRILFEFCGDRCGVVVEVVASAVDSVVRLEPSVVDFGPVGIGNTKTAQVVVYNDGAESLRLISAEVQGSAEVVARPVESVPSSIAPGASSAITLEYTPTAATTMVADLVVRTDDAGLPEARVRLTGRGEGPLFVVQPDVLNFGVQLVTTRSKRALLLLNAGSSEVLVDSIEISGDPALSLAEEDMPGLPVRLEGGESVIPSVAFVPNGVGEYQALITIHTTDPLAPIVEVPVSAGYAERSCELDIAPSRLNFGLLPQGVRRNATATLTNMGSSVCNLVSGSFSPPIDPAFSLLTGPVGPVSLAFGESIELEFEFAPTQPVDSKGTFTIMTDDPVFPARLLPLVGSAKQYDDLIVNPPIVDFGVRPIGCSSGERPITVVNTGGVEHYIDQVISTATTSEIRLTTNAPVVLPPGGSWTFNTSYQAADEGRDEADIEIHVLGRNFPLVVPVWGEGRSNAQKTDHYEQLTNRMVDVLFVVDDSCSMQEEQVALADNFNAFIQSANVRQVDFRIGITTTSIGGGRSNGELVDRWLENGTINLEFAFRSQTAVGILGSGQEQGLEAMLLAFQLADLGIGRNAGFFRGADGAMAVIIFISDEDDQSPASVDNYYTELIAYAPAGFVTAAVTGGLRACASPTGPGFADAAPRYIRFLQLTGGTDLSICSPNWSNTLSTLGDAAFGLRQRFTLSDGVDQSQPVEVTVDGQALQEGTAWEYDPASGAIQFKTGYVPSEGAAIDVAYTASCS